MANVQQAGAITVREQNGSTQVLIVQSSKDPQHWLFPKGHIEAGETAEQTAVRELREEAGVLGTIAGPVGSSTYLMGHKTVDVNYFLVRFEGTVQESEGREVRWLSVADARRALTFDDLRRLLDIAAASYASRR